MHTLPIRTNQQKMKACQCSLSTEKLVTMSKGCVSILQAVRKNRDPTSMYPTGRNCFVDVAGHACLTIYQQSSIHQQYTHARRHMPHTTPMYAYNCTHGDNAMRLQHPSTHRQPCYYKVTPRPSHMHCIIAQCDLLPRIVAAVSIEWARHQTLPSWLVGRFDGTSLAPLR